MALNLTNFSQDIDVAGQVDQDHTVELAAKYKAWIYVATDEGSDMQVKPHGFQTLSSLSSSLQASHIPIALKSLNLTMAKSVVTAISQAPRPLLITCGSSGRASAAALIHQAVTTGTNAHEAVEDARSCGLKCVGHEGLMDWVILSINSLQPGASRPPLFRQLFEPVSSTYTYLLADPETKEGVLIDPVDVMVDRDLDVIKELGVTLLYAINTHCHADHITGTYLLKQRVAGVKSMIAEASGAKADILLRDGDLIQFGSRNLQCRSTPGHTNGCMSYVLDDRSMVFTGDTLLIRGCGRTDFQEGSSEALYKSIHQRLFTLPDDTMMYPGHDYKGRLYTSLEEEKRYNPRLTQTLEGFIKTMNELGLPPPKKLQESLPRNLLDGAEP